MTLLDKIIEWVEEEKWDTELSFGDYQMTVDYEDLSQFLSKLKFMEDKLSVYKKSALLEDIKNIQKYDRWYEGLYENEHGNWVKYSDVLEIIERRLHHED